MNGYPWQDAEKPSPPWQYVWVYRKFQFGDEVCLAYWDQQRWMKVPYPRQTVPPQPITDVLAWRNLELPSPPVRKWVMT